MKSLHELVADKLERADPAARAALLQIPLDNIARWLAHGHTAPHRLEQWRRIIAEAQTSAAGCRNLVEMLRDSSDEAARLKDFSPFVGVLSRKERQTAKSECVYNF